MNPDEGQSVSERDQLWASLRVLRPQIDRLAAGEVELAEQHRPLILLLARIVAAELDYRDQASNPE